MALVLSHASKAEGALFQSIADGVMVEFASGSVLIGGVSGMRDDESKSYSFMATGS